MTVQVRGFALACMSALVLALAACGGPSDGPGGGQPTPPAAPTDVTATAGAGFVTVTWEHDGAGVTGFVISRATVQAATVQAATVAASAQQPSTLEEADRVSHDAERVQTAASVGEVGANERSFRDNAVVPGRAYRYSVVAMGSGGVASEAGVQTAPPVVPAEPDTLAFERVWEAAVARGEVRSIAISPDGTSLVTGVLIGGAHVWDLVTGEETLKLAFGSTVATVGFSPDGRMIALGGNTLALRDAHDGSEVRTIRLDDQRDAWFDWANDLAFSPDGRSISAASNNGLVRVWNVDTGDLVLTIDHAAHADAASVQGTVEPERRYVRSEADGRVLSLEPEDATGVGTAATFTRVMSVAFSPDGTLLASGGADGSVRLFDATTGALQTSIEALARLESVRFAPDGARVAVAGYGPSRTVGIWSVETGALVQPIDVPGNASVLAVAFSPDGDQLAGVDADGAAFVWDLVDEALDQSWQAHRGRSGGLAYHPDGASLATAGGQKDGRAIVWDLATGADTLVLEHAGEVSGVAISPDGEYVAGGMWDGMVMAWRADSGEPVFANDAPSSARHITYSPDGSRIAISSFRSINLLDSVSGASAVQIATPESVQSLAFDASGERIASGDRMRSLRVWDAISGNELVAIEDAHASGQLEAIAFTPDGERLISGVGYVGGQAEFAVWDVRSGAEVARREANRHGVFDVAFTPDATRMVSAGMGSLMVWDTDTWDLVSEITLPGTASSLVVTEAFVVVGGWGTGTVLFLELATGQQLGALPVASSSIGYHPASRRLVVADGPSVQVWRVVVE